MIFFPDSQFISELFHEFTKTPYICELRIAHNPPIPLSPHYKQSK